MKILVVDDQFHSDPWWMNVLSKDPRAVPMKLLQLGADGIVGVSGEQLSEIDSYVAHCAPWGLGTTDYPRAPYSVLEVDLNADHPEDQTILWNTKKESDVTIN